MVFPDTVESLKTQYTDKYVKVDATRPELARFQDVVGQVKTVNMNGRALVEFLDYHTNIGWFDIDLACLTIVDKPVPGDYDGTAMLPIKIQFQSGRSPAASFSNSWSMSQGSIAPK